MTSPADTNDVFLNGQFLSAREARISPFDRGFIFGDGIYEVTTVIGSKLVAFDEHMDRLERSAREVKLELPADRARLKALHLDLIRRNNLTEGSIYMQVTRGAALRDFAFPAEGQPSLFLFTRKASIVDHPLAKKGVEIILQPDIRWKRSDIKTTNLLGAVLAKQAAVEAGVDDCWFVEDGYITEGSSNNAFIITEDDKVVTRSLSNRILPGITRQLMLDILGDEGLAFEERPFSTEELRAASEAFLTSATTILLPVVRVEGKPIGTGQAGQRSKSLRRAFLKPFL